MTRTKKPGHKKAKTKERATTYKRRKGGQGSGNGGTLYDPITHPTLAFRLGLLGLTDVQIATAFDVNRTTIDNWKQQHPKFRKALLEGKQSADAKVAESLYQKAIGYSHDDLYMSMYKGQVIKTKIKKHYPPSDTAAIFWLKNRTRHLDQPWNDAFRHEVSGPGGGPVDLKQKIKVDGLEAEEISKLVELGLKLQNNSK